MCPARPRLSCHSDLAPPAPPPSPVCAAGPRALAFNPAENAVLVQTDVEGGSYELYAVPKDAAGREVAPVRSAAGKVWVWSWAGAGAGKLLAVPKDTAGREAAPVHCCDWVMGCWVLVSRVGAGQPCEPCLRRSSEQALTERVLAPPHPRCPARPQDAKRGFSAAAVFIARNRFAVLDRGANQIVIKDLANEARRLAGPAAGAGRWEGACPGLADATPPTPAACLRLLAHRSQVTKKVTSPLPTTDNIFYAGTGMLLCRSEEKARSWAARMRLQDVVAGVGPSPERHIEQRSTALLVCPGRTTALKPSPCCPCPLPYLPPLSLPSRWPCLTCSSAAWWRSWPPRPSSMRCGAGT